MTDSKDREVKRLTIRIDEKRLLDLRQFLLDEERIGKPRRSVQKFVIDMIDDTIYRK